MANTLKIKRGTAATIPQGQLAEPLFTTDTYDLYIGKGSGGNQRIQNYIASGTSSQFLKGDGSLDSTTYQATSEKGQNNGYASLDAGGKIPAAQLPSSVIEYKGTWNASTNTPTLADGTGDAGDVYIVSVGGTQNLGSGSITFDAGDWVMYNGSVWQKSTGSNAVASVNGQTGIVSIGVNDLDDATITSPSNGQLLQYSTGTNKWVNWTPTYISAAITSLNGLTGATQTFATGTTGTDFGISSAGTVHTFNLPIASATNTGKLSSTDWSTFNAKEPALTKGNLTETTSSVLTITGGTGAVIGSGTTIQVKLASGTQNGYLSSTDWTTFNNKLTSPMTTLGDIIFGGTSGNANRLAGNITTTKQYLSQTGTGTESASPVWATILGSDITGAALTKSDDTNVTLTLGGTPATALLRAASLTLGWTGTLAVSRGGTGASSFGSNEIIYGNSASALQSSNQFTFSPTGVFFINNTISAGGIAMNLTSTVNAAANNDIIYGVRISPTFSNGAFTGVTQRALGVFGDVYINGTITSGAWGGSTITIAKGGTGLTALGTAGQLLRVNSGATALEYWTPTYISAAITSLNGLTDSVQTFATGTTGTDFNISSASGVHTFNIPSASASNRGLVTTGTQTFAGAKTFSSAVTSTSFTASILFSVQNAGADGVSDGPFYRYLNSTNSRQILKQLNANSGEDTWAYDGTATWTKIATLSSGGAVTFLSTGSFGGNLTLNNGSDLILTPASSGGNATLYNDIGNLVSTASIEVQGTGSFSSTVAGYGLSVTNVQDSSQGLLVRSSDNDTTLYLARFQSSVGATSQTWVDRFSIAKNGSTVIGDNIPAVNVRLWVKGEDQTASNYALDVTDSVGSSIAWFRNDKAIRFYGGLTATSATFNHNDAPTIKVQRNGGTDSNTVIEFTNASRNFYIGSNGTVMGLGGTSGSVAAQPLQISSTGAATFSSSVTAQGMNINGASDATLSIVAPSATAYVSFRNVGGKTWGIGNSFVGTNTNFQIYNLTDNVNALSFVASGAATFSSSVRSKAMSVDGTGGSGFLAQLDGNNTAANGAYFGFVNAANTRYFINQLDTNNDINYYYFNGSSWSSSIIKLSNSGGGTFTGNLVANSPSAGNTGEGIIAGTSFKIDAGGTGQKAKMFVVSKDLSDTYGSGLQIQFANQADDKGFGFNLNTSGDYETYVKSSGGSWVRRLRITQNGDLFHNRSDQSAYLHHNGSINVGNGSTLTINVANGSLLMISENNTGNGALFFCGYKSATITLISDPDGKYATSDTAGRACVYKNADSGNVTFKNNLGDTRSFTFFQIRNSD